MSGAPFTASERLAVLELKVEHMESEVDRMSKKVDEMHAILLQAKGFRMPFVILGTVAMGGVGAIAHWLLAKIG